ncbi:MAG: double-strand break repair helicase AddA, partial [Alphaproteobacteria bacterium]|nr:double-strand break repair helicase AddA [Alphaproteobacteria bacterium]
TAPDEELDTALVRLGAEAPDGDRRNRARRLFARTVDAPVGLRIDTIHAFCQSLLGCFPIEAGVSPWFQLADEREALTRQANARDAVLERRGDGMEAVAAEIADNLSEYNIRAFIAELLRNRSAFGPGALAALEAGLVLPEVPERTKKATKALREAASILAGGTKTDKEHAERLQAWAGTEDLSDDDIEEVRKVFYKSNGEPREELGTKHLAGGERLPGLLDEECERIERMRARRKIEATLNASRAALALGEAVDGEYRRSKGRAGLLDYDDLIEHALGLLQSYSAAWVHYKLDRGIDHVLIDEAQDTSPSQWGLVEALTQEFFAGEGAGEEARTLFAVGDPKQSIYRFQGAEPKKFGDMRETFRTRAEGAGRRWEDVPLEVSFRAAPVLLEAVDAVFAGEHGLGLEGPAPRHRASRAGAGGRVEIWPLEIGEKEEPGDPFEPPTRYSREDAAETALADRVAGRIAGWLEQGEPVAPGGRPMRAGDIMILLPRRSGRAFIPRVIASLKQAGVPFAGIDRMTLAEELAVMDLAAIGDFVLLPEDDLTLATVLKGPLFGFDDGALFELARGRKGTLWAALGKRRDTERFGLCFEALSALLGKADYVGVHAFFADLLAEGGLRRRIAARLGEEANDPIDEFLNAALDYERRHASSLQGFLQWLRSGEAEVKRQLDQRGRNEVRVSTVHGAKGLEAAVVILPDTAAAPAHPSRRQALYRDGGLLLWPPSTNRDRIDPVSEALLERVEKEEEEEHRRLLYVAMTRAADRLVVCGWSNSGRKLPDDCWYNVLWRGLRDSMTVERNPDWPEPDEDEDIPDWLRELPRQLAVMERRATEAEAERPAADRELLPPLPDWARAPVAAEPVPPSGDDGEAFAPASPLRGGSAGRFRRGRAIHKLLELLPEIAPERRLETARRFLAADPELATGAEAAAREVMAVLDDPAFSRVFGPGSRAEAPLVGRIGGEIVSARIDRLALLPEETLIVDFKSGRAPPAGPAEAPAAYLRQLARYVALLRQMRPDRPVRAALLWTEAPLLMPIPESCLAPYMP